MIKINPDLVRLNDILQAIADIEDYKLSDFSDKKSLHAILYNIAIIGEAAGKVSFHLKEKYIEIPWEAIVNMRHRIVHDYGNVNINTVKEVVAGDLPVLKVQITSIIEYLKSA